MVYPFLFGIFGNPYILFVKSTCL